MPIFRRYFAGLHRLVKPNGLALNHGITTTDPRGVSRGPRAASFIDRYVFPGGELPHIAQVVRARRSRGSTSLDIEACGRITPRRCSTGCAGSKRSGTGRSTLAGEERYRIWRIYMAGCAVAFARNWLSLYQVVCGKSGADGSLVRPWTRRHVYDGDPAPAMARSLDWGCLGDL